MSGGLIDRFLQNYGALPSIGVELEVILRDTVTGRVVYDEGVIESIREKLEREGFCVGTEAGGTRLPPRIEIVLCRPIKDVREIVEYFRKAIEKLRELGYEPIFKWHGFSGSTHVTLDMPLKELPDEFKGLLYKLSALTDTYDRKHLCNRLAIFGTLTPIIEICAKSASAVADSEYNVKNVAVIEDPSFVVRFLPSRVTSPATAREAVKALKSGDMDIEIGLTSP